MVRKNMEDDKNFTNVIKLSIVNDKKEKKDLYDKNSSKENGMNIH